MEPATLRIHLGEKVKSKINISLSEHVAQKFQYIGNFSIGKEYIRDLNNIGYKKNDNKVAVNDGNSIRNISIKHEEFPTSFQEDSTTNTTLSSYSNSGRAFPDVINGINSAGDNDNTNGVLFRNQSEKRDFTPFLKLLQLAWCCEDDSIVEIHPELKDIAVRNLSKAFTITVEGISLGRTSIRFLVQRSDLRELTLQSQSSISHDTINQETRWWFPHEYKIIVMNRETQLPFYANILLLGNLIFLSLFITTLSEYWITLHW